MNSNKIYYKSYFGLRRTTGWFRCGLRLSPPFMNPFVNRSRGESLERAELKYQK